MGPGITFFEKLYDIRKHGSHFDLAVADDNLFQETADAALIESGFHLEHVDQKS